MTGSLQQQQRYLAQLMEAVQRSAFFLNHSQAKLSWPLKGGILASHAKDAELFETLAAINERFAKLQDTLASAMRHTALLLGEDADSFLKVLTFFEKLGILTSVSQWQQCRVVRNMAAHEYDLDYDGIAEHFNTLNELTPMLLHTARRLLQRVEGDLNITPASANFSADFNRLFD